MLKLIYFFYFIFLLNSSSHSYPVYQLSNLTDTQTGYTGKLNLVSGTGPYTKDFTPLQVDVIYLTENVLRVKISDPNTQRWEVPDVVKLQAPTTKPKNVNYQIDFTDQVFGFSVSRNDGEVLFNTTPPTSSSFNPLIFEDQYLEISSQLDSTKGNHLYGLGERVGSLLLESNQTYTLYNKDEGFAAPKVNGYGSHPFFLNMRSNTGKSYGVFVLNSNAMDVEYQEDFIQYRMIGGIIDIYFFVGPTPSSVVQQYLSVIGLPYFFPYWALGWHQCRWGYSNITETAQVALNYTKYDIPLEVMWNDIDYMEEYKDFTFDGVNFPVESVNEFVEYLHSKSQKYVVIVDPGIAYQSGYFAYDIGQSLGIWINKSDSVTPIVGAVWPGLTVFPDFTNQKTVDYWLDQLTTFHQLVPVDGIWIDMNEIASWCDGECPTSSTTKPQPPSSSPSFLSKEESYSNRMKSSSPPSESYSWDSPPYTPGRKPLNASTLSMSSTLSKGINYNLHNLYAFYEAIATQSSFEKITGKRSFVLSRSSFSGSGHYTAHWLGDNWSQYSYLESSISGMLIMNIFGIPLVGADICGFNGETTEELCTRWTQLGSFYPFSRNHNARGQRSQEPWVFSTQHLDICRESIRNRYYLIPYYYTLFYRAHTYGDTVVRPLFFEFTLDEKCYSIDDQFLVGSSILVSPALSRGQTTVQGYLPSTSQDRWFDYWKGTEYSGGQSYTFDAPIDVIPVHIRGGSVVPVQEPDSTLTAARNNPFGLLVALDSQQSAEGSLYLDDGESLSVGDQFSLINFSVSSSTNYIKLTSSAANDGYKPSGLLGHVRVYGQSFKPSSITVNGSSHSLFEYSPTTKILDILGIDISMIEDFSISWSS